MNSWYPELLTNRRIASTVRVHPKRNHPRERADAYQKWTFEEEN